MKSVSYDAVMSPGAREKIDNGEWRVIGLSVMDTSNGRMVANLKTVTKSNQSEYTPALFVALRDEICLSQRLMSIKIRESFDKQRSILNRIEGKIDFLTDVKFAELAGEINHFFTQCDHLHTSEAVKAERVLDHGGRLAARLAGITDALIDDYLGSVQLVVGNETMDYSMYTSREYTTGGYRYEPDVTEMTYPDFIGTRVKSFLGTLIEMLNSLNLISVCFNQELYMGYMDSLTALRVKLRALLNSLVFGVPVKEGKFKCKNYRALIFTKDRNGDWVQDNEAERLAQYYTEFSHNNLAASIYERTSGYVKRDENLFAAVTAVLNFIEDIDLLLSRGTELTEGSIMDTESIKLLSETIFPSRTNRLLTSTS